jgi:PqqD family protein of HPr-rel-A system
VASETQGGSISWCAVAPSTILWNCWGEDCVLFHRQSGKTHVANSATILLLTRVLVEPKTAERAAEELAELQEAAPGQQYAAEIAALLAHLDHLGLVERRDA